MARCQNVQSWRRRILSHARYVLRLRCAQTKWVPDHSSPDTTRSTLVHACIAGSSTLHLRTVSGQARASCSDHTAASYIVPSCYSHSYLTQDYHFEHLVLPQAWREVPASAFVGSGNSTVFSVVHRRHLALNTLQTRQSQGQNEKCNCNSELFRRDLMIGCERCIEAVLARTACGPGTTSDYKATKRANCWLYISYLS